MNMTKEMIIKKTIEAVSKKGDAASMKDIAKHCRMSAASIYYHFKNKHELIYESMLYVAYKVGGEIVIVLNPEDTLENNYKNAMKAVVKFVKRNPHEAFFYTQLTLMPSFALTPEEAEFIDQSCPMVKLFKQGITDGLLYDIPTIVLLAYRSIYFYALNNLKSTKQQDELFINRLWAAIAV